MVSHDSAHRVEPEPCAFSYSLGSEKRIEDMGLNFRRDTGAIVSNLHQHTIKLPRGTQPDFTLALHGFDGVIDEVGPDLIELASVGANLRQRPVILAHHRYS